MKSPMTDLIVDEIRSVRDKHAAQFGYDIRTIFKDIQDQQTASRRKFVRYPARPATASADKSGRNRVGPAIADRPPHTT